MGNIFIRILFPQVIFLIFIITSCSYTRDYYNSDDYNIRQRQKESLKMFEKTHQVRKKCSKKYNKHPRAKRKSYYS
jgi:hypothetical protein